MEMLLTMKPVSAQFTLQHEARGAPSADAEFHLLALLLQTMFLHIPGAQFSHTLHLRHFRLLKRVHLVTRNVVV